MECIVEHDPTLIDIANLPPGWGAYREALGSEWECYEMEQAE
ncbi:hypothetical protein QF013_004144 [Pseudomonas laurylsulfatiphila]|jgi:hypothetical protein